MLFDYIGAPKQYKRIRISVPRNAQSLKIPGESVTLQYNAALEEQKVQFLVQLSGITFERLRQGGGTEEITLWYQRGRRSGKIRAGVVN